MRIVSVELKNIRSYVHETIEIPEGSTILSGDIGSGKTTILLAIEFALFGIMKGTLSPASLLRHGSNEGHVELKAVIDNKELIINRKLKRSKSGIKQDAGYIIIDGIRTEGTATELKARILSILGYPDELLTKSKSLIYRYTVYTPQEEMNQILMESSEERLNTIRKIFNIDKYRIIKDNTSLLLRELRQEKAILIAKAEDYPNLKADQKDKTVLLAKRREEEVKILARLKELSIDNIQKRLQQAEFQCREMEKAKTNLKLVNQKISHISQSQKQLTAEIRQYEQQEKIEPPVEKELSEDIRSIESGIRELEDKLAKTLQKKGQLTAMKNNSQSIADNIRELKNCPTCEQEVPLEHKTQILSREMQKIEKIQSNLVRLGEIKNNIQLSTEELKEKLRNMNSQQRQLEVQRVRYRNYLEKSKQSEKMQLSLNEIESSLQILAREKSVLDLGISTQAQEAYDAVKKEYETAREALHRAEIDLTRTKTEIRNIEEHLEVLSKDISALIKIRQHAERITEVQNWLESFFYKLVDLIERQILLKVYSEFNNYFQEWFNSLMDDENLSVRLSEDFSPAIEQNGHETYIENLSGGEKTSVALAYRLALFRIINEFIGDIKTRDIIILDEPTDGFSTEQLDRVRDVLLQLKTRQTIIVSHEQKVESFVDNIIRIVKQEHTSRVS